MDTAAGQGSRGWLQVLQRSTFARDFTTLPRLMGWKRKISGGFVATVGYLLSPLSWWNDAFVNLPLAVAFAWLISAFYKPAFQASVVIGYWATNVLGFILLHKGAQKMLTEKEMKYSRRNLLRD